MISYDILKYFLLGASVFIILKFIPNNELSNMQLITFTFILLVVYIIFDTIFNSQNDIPSIEVDKLCNTVCTRENMVNTNLLFANAYDKEHVVLDKSLNNDLNNITRSNIKQIENTIPQMNTCNIKQNQEIINEETVKQEEYKQETIEQEIDSESISTDEHNLYKYQFAFDNNNHINDYYSYNYHMKMKRNKKKCKCN